MKNILFIFSMMISTIAFSRTTEEIKIHGVQVERQAGNLNVSFMVDVPRHAVRSNYKLILTPIVYNQKQEIALTPIEIIGKKRAKREKQELLLSRELENIPDGLIAPQGETYTYTATIPYAEWMDIVSLRIDRTEKGCCKENKLPSMILAEGINLVPKPRPVPVVTPPAEPVQEKVQEQQFAIYFRFNRADIDTAFSNNSQTLEKVVEYLKQNKKAKIQINGFASPEGQETWNEKLAHRRAQALERYLVDRGWIEANATTVVNYTINWKGLRDYIAASDLPFKADVLNILDNTSSVELTNRKLQALQGGVPYQYLVKKIYPKLRIASLLITNF